MTVELATKAAKVATSDKYFKWAALGVGTAAVAGIGLGGIYLWSKRPKLPQVPTDIGGLPSWLISPQDQFGGMSPIGGMSPLLGLLELLGIRDKLGDSIDEPGDLIKCNTGKPSLFKTLLLMTNPTVAAIYQQACKSQESDDSIRDEYENKITVILSEHSEELAKLRADARAESSRLYDRIQEIETELRDTQLDASRAFQLEQLLFDTQKRLIISELERTGQIIDLPGFDYTKLPPTISVPDTDHVLIPVIPPGGPDFEEYTGMTWKRFSEIYGNDRVDAYMHSIGVPEDEHSRNYPRERIIAWNFFSSLEKEELEDFFRD